MNGLFTVQHGDVRGAKPAAVDGHKQRMREELHQLERYLASLKHAAASSLAALHNGAASAAGPPPDAAPPPSAQQQQQLLAALAALQAENAALRAAAAAASGRGSAASAAAAPAAALESQCRELQQQLAAAREELAAASAAAARQNGIVSTSTAAAAPAAADAALSFASLAAVRAQLARLREDKEQLEGQVVEMYEAFFSDAVVKGVVAVVRKKEASMLAAGGDRGGDSGGGGGGGRPAPRMKAKLDEALATIEKLERELEHKGSEMHALQRHHDDLTKIHRLESEGMLNLYKERWTVELQKRKKLHQRVLELKGAIRVFCRVRPLVAKEDGSGAACVVVRDEENLSITVERDVDRSSELRTGGIADGASGAQRRPPSRGTSRTPPRRNGAEEDEPRAGREFNYEFDRVFAPTDTQEVVYEDVEDLVVSVADGYNVCIMAYGQTGSGKTYTMQGPSDNPGINIRALRSLFELAGERVLECEMSFTTSILEIYNECIFDLLSETPRESAGKLDIKEQGGHIWIPGLQMVKVASMEDVERLIERGSRNRSTFATDMNEHSSRSHLILSMYLRCDNRVTGERTASKLHLIDLAGSERVSRSHAEGDRLREAQNINSSLSALGDVIQSLQQHKEHIPYRNCKLTRLLSDSLGGQSKTLLVVNLSPTRESAGESRCSCDFASRAKKVELGRASRQVEVGAAPPSKSPSSGNLALRSYSAPRIKSAQSLSADPQKLRTGANSAH